MKKALFLSIILIAALVSGLYYYIRYEKPTRDAVQMMDIGVPYKDLDVNKVLDTHGKFPNDYGVTLYEITTDNKKLDFSEWNDLPSDKNAFDFYVRSMHMGNDSHIKKVSEVEHGYWIMKGMNQVESAGQRYYDNSRWMIYDSDEKVLYFVIIDMNYKIDFWE